MKKISKGGREAGERRGRGQAEMLPQIRSTLGLAHSGHLTVVPDLRQGGQPFAQHCQPSLPWAAPGYEMEAITPRGGGPGQQGQFCREGSSFRGGINPSGAAGEVCLPGRKGLDGAQQNLPQCHTFRRLRGSSSRNEGRVQTS